MMITIDSDEVVYKAIKARGPGGQHVNSASTAIQLRFDIWASSLPASVKTKLAALNDERISSAGVIVIKAMQQRSQLRNKEQALERLNDLVLAAQQVTKKRIPSKPSKRAKQARLDAKTQLSNKKKWRGAVKLDE